MQLNVVQRADKKRVLLESFFVGDHAFFHECCERLQIDRSLVIESPSFEG